MNKKIIKVDQNDYFTTLKGLDLQDLLMELQTYFLEYRRKLNLSDNLQFGVEIEYENLPRRKSDKFVFNNLKDWNPKGDGSLTLGGEITSPIMTDKEEYWQELKIICDYLTKKKADTMHNAGGHIHIGACILGDDLEAWKTFLKLYTAYENVLFRFIYGDKISGRKGITKYARPIADYLHSKLDKINSVVFLTDIADILNLIERYSATNFHNVKFSKPTTKEDKNTIEFRSPNATTNAIIWQNNINTFAKMLISSKNKVINTDFLDYKLTHDFNPYSEYKYLYNIVNLKNALEFVDLVFDNNLDKIYFLKQYLKNYEENYNLKFAVRARKFSK